MLILERSLTLATKQETARNRVNGWPCWLTFLVILLADYLLISPLSPGTPQRVEVSYTFFRRQVEAGNVAEINSRADTILGTFRKAAPYPDDGGDAAKSVTDFSTVRPAFADPGLEALLNQQGVTINARPTDEPARRGLPCGRSRPHTSNQ